jgi:hypothetical protein
MKKVYSRPFMRVIDIQTVQLMSGSKSGKVTGINQYNGAGPIYIGEESDEEARSRSSNVNVWDDNE